MAPVGGSIQKVSLDGNNYAVTADTDSNKKLGGVENDVQANGDGTARLLKTRIALSVDGLVISIDDTTGDAEIIENLKLRNDFFPIIVYYASGAIWQGVGQITGETPGSSATATMTISLMGPGILTRQQ